MSPPPPAALIYDGHCGFCRRWADRVRRWDRAGRLEVLPFQTPDLEERFPNVSRQACTRRIHVVDEAGRVYAGAAAGREVLARLPGGRLWSLPFRLPGAMRIAEPVYGWITRRWGPLGGDAAGDTALPLLDGVMPEFDFRSRHTIVVEASRPAVVAAAEEFRFDESLVARMLFRLRGLRPTPGPSRSLLRGGGAFSVLAEQPGEEIVLGIAGRFWALNEPANLVAPASAGALAELGRAGLATATMGFRFVELSAAATRVVTETRVRCVDPAARRRFALYWAVIAPFSGCLRWIMLRGVRRHALAMGGACV